jgi:hypothetical protein
MNPNSDDFETLRKLMALKRHEQPPAEYLDRLSDRIITRIEHGEGRMNLWDKLSASISLRPGVVYACGLTVCGALGLTSVCLVRHEMETAESATSPVRVPVVTALAVTGPDRDETATLHVANWMGVTNPVTDPQAEASLFRSSHLTVPVSYHPGN